MVLIVCQRSDPHVDFVEAELERRRMSWARLHLSDFPEHVHASYHIGQPSACDTLVIANRTIPLADISAVWYRRTESPRLPDDLSGGDRTIALAECREFIRGLWHAVPHARWVSPPHAIRGADVKAEQLRRARQLGFNVPRTCFSNHPAAILAFCESLGGAGRVVYKPHTSILVPVEAGNQVAVVYTTALDEETLARIDEIRWAPGIFQENLSKSHELRVTVFGGRAFAVAIHSQEHEATRQDWRSYSWQDRQEFPRHEPVPLPPALERQCIDFTTSYGLAFGAIDLVVTAAGDLYFLELNPNGQWVWLEQQTGLPMAAALCDLFAEPGR